MNPSKGQFDGINTTPVQKPIGVTNRTPIAPRVGETNVNVGAPNLGLGTIKTPIAPRISTTNTTPVAGPQLGAVNKSYSKEDPADEYRTLGDEPAPKIKYVTEKPDKSEYMMRQVRPDEVVNRNVQDLHTYYSKGGYQYGSRKKK